MDSARWFWRAIEVETGWRCRHGMDVIDEHATLAASLDHLRELASAEPPAEVLVHYADGHVSSAFMVD